MNKVTSLQRQEPARLDSGAIKLLENSLGAVRCREVVEEACFVMIDKLAGLELALHKADKNAAMALSKKLATLSGQIGLADFSRVATDLHMCLSRSDVVTQKAIAARLMRLGEASLMTVLQITEDPYS